MSIIQNFASIIDGMKHSAFPLPRHSTYCIITCVTHQSSLSPSFSSSIFSSFPFILSVSSFMQVVVTTTVLKVMALCPSKGCNNRIHRPMLKNKGVIFIYLLIWHLFFVCVFLLMCVEMVWRRS